MNTTSKTLEKLKKGKAYREAYVTSQINVGIPFQIRALRKQQGMDQKALAALAGMVQPRISAMESPGYGSFTIDTLKRLAAAFDVALIVRFAPFTELIKHANDFNPEDFEAHTLGFQKEIEKLGALLAAQETAEPASKVVAKICRNAAGQIYMTDEDGNSFDMSKYIGKSLYTTPQPLPVVQQPEQAQELSDDSLSLMLDKAFNEEIAHVSSIEYNSHEICSHFYSKLMKRFWAVRSLMGKTS